ncbi:MAG: NfeD family protein [Thermoguttaceae bacterium]
MKNTTPASVSRYGAAFPAASNRWLAVCAVLFAALATLAAPAFARDEPKAPRQIGRFIQVALPISDQTAKHVRQVVGRAIDRAKRDNARLTLVFEFRAPKGQKDAGRGSDFSQSYSLANYLSSDELNGVRTVAYLPNSVEGHAVLPVIACQEIIMAKDATLGAAGIDEKTISPTMRSAYSEIAGRRWTVPVVIALGMLDPAIEVLQVKTDERDQKYVTPEELEALKKTHATEPPVVVKRAGEQGMFSGIEARRWGLASYLAADRRDLAKALELPSTTIEDDPSLEGGWKAVRVDLKSPLLADTVEKAQRMIEEQIRQEQVNFICLWIDSPGGSVRDAMQLANFLGDLDPSKVRTVAYIPNEARSDAAIVALACDQVVVHPRTVLGGSGAYELSPDEVKDVVRVIRELAPRKGRSWSLMAAMVDPHLDVYRATRLGNVEYFCDEERREQLEPGKWNMGEPVTVPNKPLLVDGTKAEEYHLANYVVDNFAQFKQCYGLEGDPTLVEPGWASVLIDALASPGVAVLLLIIGGSALYFELHAPGVGIGAFVALVCFLLFFWSRYLGHTAGWLEALLFIAGVSCLLLEIFVIPGFGIFGLGGGAMVLASIILASQTSKSFIPQNDYQRDELFTSLLTVAAACFGMIAFAVLLRNRLPHSRLFGNFMLEPPAGEEAEIIRRREALVNFHDLLGTRGTTTTQLTPCGKARFDDLLVDVIADGEVIDRGTEIEVVEVRGSRVLVRRVEEDEGLGARG